MRKKFNIEIIYVNKDKKMENKCIIERAIEEYKRVIFAENENTKKI